MTGVPPKLTESDAVKKRLDTSVPRGLISVQRKLLLLGVSASNT